MGHWREEGRDTADVDWSSSLGLSLRSEDRNRSIRVNYSWGRADETFRHFYSFAGFWKREQLAVSYGGSVLRHQDRGQQHVLSFNYDLTSTVSIGGRLVFERDELEDDNRWNPYLTFRRSGEAGIETFLIVGDPSGDEFVRRIEGKVLLPL